MEILRRPALRARRGRALASRPATALLVRHPRRRAAQPRRRRGPALGFLGELASAAGWIDRDHLLVATETGLWRFGLLDGAKEPIAAIAADAPQLRSNDGRADPWGGFWIGTMAKAGKAPGSIWRYWKGELRELYPGIATPNAICFDAGRELGYFADTPLGKVWAQPLDPATGWPKGEPRLFLEDILPRRRRCRRRGPDTGSPAGAAAA